MENIETIINDVLNGNTEEFRYLVREYQTPIYNYILQITKNSHDAEDLTQEVFFTAYKKLNSLREHNKFKSWLYGIAYNTAMGYLRRKAIKGFVTLDMTVLESLANKSIQKDSESLDLLEYLKPNDRSLIYLKYCEEMSYKELSVVFDSSEQSLRKKVERIKRKLREKHPNPEGGLSNE